MKELKVGQRITLDVIEQIDCDGCFFFDGGICYSPHCESYERSDGKNVIFKEVKE